MRVVLDTNILISACWTPTGLEARLLQLVISGDLTACVSPPVWAEYRDVLSRGKFAAVRSRTSSLLDTLESRIHLVNPSTPVTAALDDDDNRFLECASASFAPYLITGNLKHYPHHWGSTQIVNARAFLAVEFAQILADRL